MAFVSPKHGGKGGGGWVVTSVSRMSKAPKWIFTYRSCVVYLVLTYDVESMSSSEVISIYAEADPGG